MSVYVSKCRSLSFFRDLKCENVLLDSDNNVKVSDFGFAISIKSSSSKINTNCGSYAYAAPEILNAKPYIGSQTDIWSLFVGMFTSWALHHPHHHLCPCSQGRDPVLDGVQAAPF